MYAANAEQSQRKPCLQRTRAPTSAQRTELAGTIAHRICRHLARRGWLAGEDETVYLSDSAAGDEGIDGLRMSSITYRIATGRDAGRKVVTLQTLPGDAGSLDGDAGKIGGFSLHADVAAEAQESHKLEKLCRRYTTPCEARHAGPVSRRQWEQVQCFGGKLPMDPVARMMPGWIAGRLSRRCKRDNCCPLA